MSRGRGLSLVLVVVLLASCGGAPAKEPEPRATEPAPPSAAAPAPAKKTAAPPVPFEAIASPSDVVAPWVRPEHSSRLGVALPRGRAREVWTSALDPKLDPAFVLAAGARILVQGRAIGAAGARQAPFVLFDAHGVGIASDWVSGEHVRLEPAEGKLYGIGGAGAPSAWKLSDGSRTTDKLGADDPRTVSGPLAVRATAHDGNYVFITQTEVEIDLRASGRQRTVVEPPVQPLDAAIDDDGNLDVIVRQDRDLALWTTPLSGGSVGRIRLGPLRRERAMVPPVLGKTVRVVVVDDRMIALGQDGKTLWERRGALTGGATITSDDRLLVATDGKVLAVDSAGRATELAVAPKEVFLTPPILTGGGLLLVASGTLLHAYGFE